MIKSDSIGQLAKALSAAQGEMNGAKKDSQNPFFKSNYSDLESVIEAIRTPFVKNGLSFTQLVSSGEDGSANVTTLLLHSSGEFIGSTVGTKPLDNKPQTLGSLITYLKRYGLQALAGVPSVDDDGEQAQGRSHEPPKAPSTPSKFGLGPSEKQLNRLFAIQKSSGWEPSEVGALIRSKFNLSNSKELSREQYEELCQFLEKNKPDRGDLI